MTGNKEDYIKIIYELGGNKTIIANKAISKALGVSAPSVSEMIGKLVKDGYVDYISYHGVKLTNLGMDLAIKIRKRHLLWEVFLVEKLGYSWEEVHEEAEILEHITSQKLEDALEKYLNYPKYCPHGSPIISSRDEDTGYMTLEDIEPDKLYKIIRFSDNGDTISFIDSILLKIGDILRLLNYNREDGSIFISSGGRETTIPSEYIKRIYVEIIN